jgi:hypothetical protein
MRLTPAFLCLALTLVGPVAIDGAPVTAIRRASPDTADVTFGHQKDLADVDIVPSLKNPHVGADINPCKENLLGLVGPECRHAKAKVVGHKKPVVAGGVAIMTKATLVKPDRDFTVSDHPSAAVHVGGQKSNSPDASTIHGDGHHNGRQGHHNAGQQGGESHRHSGIRGQGGLGRGGYRGDRGQHHHDKKRPASQSGREQDHFRHDHHKGNGEASQDHTHPSVLLDLEADKILPLNALKSGVHLGSHPASTNVHAIKQAVQQSKGTPSNTAHKSASAEHDDIASGGMIDCSSHGGLAALTSLNINSCNGANGSVTKGNNNVVGSIQKGNSGLLNVLHRRQDDGDADEPQDDGQAATAATSEPAGEWGAGSSEEPSDGEDGQASYEEHDYTDGADSRLIWPRGLISESVVPLQRHHDFAIHRDESPSRKSPWSKVNKASNKRKGAPQDMLIAPRNLADVPTESVGDTLNRLPITSAQEKAKIVKGVVTSKSRALQSLAPDAPVDRLSAAYQAAGELPAALPQEKTHSVNDAAFTKGQVLKAQAPGTPVDPLTVPDQVVGQIPASSAQSNANTIEDAAVTKGQALESKAPNAPLSPSVIAKKVVDQLPASLAQEKADTVKNAAASTADDIKSKAAGAPVSPQDVVNPAQSSDDQRDVPSAGPILSTRPSSNAQGSHAMAKRAKVPARFLHLLSKSNRATRV